MSAMKEQLLALEVGQNCAVFIRLAGRYGGLTVLPEGEVAELVGLEGEHIAWAIPETFKRLEGRGFGGAPTTRYYFRAVIEEGDRKVLVAGHIGQYQTLANVKRLTDRPNPVARDAPRQNYAKGKYKASARRRAGFDYEDSDEL